MKKIVSLATMLSLLFPLPQSMVAFAEENGEKSAETTVSNSVEKATEANVVGGVLVRIPQKKRIRKQL